MLEFLSADRRAGLLRDLGTDDSTLSRDYLAAARAVLAELVAAPELVRQLPLERKAGGYTRNLLAGNDKVSIWAIVWDAGAATCIHDHHCSCCFGVVSGAITETWYRSIGGGKAVATGMSERAPGYVAAMLPSGPNIHRMQNLQAEEAISIHIYGYDHELHASSVETEFTAVDG